MAIKIFIDQGHNPSGYHNAGAEGFGLREQDVTYNVGVYLRELLDADGRFETMLSRETPDTVLGTNNSTSLQERVSMANSWPADYFVSIHCNSNVNPAINGSEVYVYALETQAAALAAEVLAQMVAQVGTKDNGVRVNSSLYVLRRTMMPAILVELAYLSNYQDNQKLARSQAAFARAIYAGLLSYFDLTAL